MDITQTLWGKTPEVARAAKREKSKWPTTLPTEHQEQVAFFRWFRAQHPKKLIFATPNGGARHIVVAKKLCDEGAMPGVPDMCIPEPHGGMHGLWIEMKRVKGGKVSLDQSRWHLELAARGYTVRVCYGCDEAIAAVQDYFRPCRP